MLSFITLAVALAVARVAWTSPRIAVWLGWLTVPAYLVKLTLGPLPTNLWEVVVITVAVGLAARHPREAGATLRTSCQRLGWPAVLLGLGVIVGLAVSPDLRLGLGIAKGWFLVPLLLYWLTIWQVRPADIVSHVLTLVVTTIPLSLVALAQVATQIFITVDGRASGWFVSANYLSMYLVPVLLLGTIVIQTGAVWQRRLAYLAWGLGLAAIYSSFSFGGWLALVAGILIWVAMRWHRRWWEWIWGIILPALAVASQWQTERFQYMLDLTQRSSISVRWQVWQTALAMIKAHPVTGIGLGQFRDQYLNYASWLFSPPWELAILHAHNVYLQFWVNAGLLGLVGWVWLAVDFFRRAARRSTPQTIGLVAAMAATLIHGLGDTTYWKNDLAAIFWLILALQTIMTDTSTSTKV